jgi:hypothetical protein
MYRKSVNIQLRNQNQEMLCRNTLFFSLLSKLIGFIKKGTNSGTTTVTFKPTKAQIGVIL